jgi:Fe-S-cluster containining protein
MSSNKSQVLQELEVKTEKEIRNKLRANKNKIYAVNLVEFLLKKIDSLVKLVINERKVQLACKAGCNHCCVLRVELWEPEVFYIADKIKKYPEDERALIIRDLEDFSEKTKGLSANEHMALAIPCVFLKNGSCSIYEFRPFPCRRWHSLDVTACETHRGGVPGNEELVTKADAITRGFEKAYEKNNLSLRPTEFRQALLLALTDEFAVDRWMKGERVFASLPEHDGAQNLFIQ